MSSKKISFYCFDEIDSTNKFCIENFLSLNDNSIVIADTQTSGKGRFNRAWKSDTVGNIYATILLKNISTNPTISTITQYTSLIIKEVLQEFITTPKIKWPNDILINDKKICGILSSAIFKENKIDALIIGFGINLIGKKEDFASIDKPATSLFIESGKIVDKDEIITKIAYNFFKNLDNYLSNGFECIKKEYIKNSLTYNTNVKISTPNGLVEGFAKDINDNGELVIIDNNNKIININTGDVLWKEQLGPMG